MKKMLWDELGLTKDFQYKNVDNAYLSLKNKTPRARFAWKVLRDKYYSEVYRKYQDEELLVKAGFFEDDISEFDLDFEKLNLLTTPFDKIKKDLKSCNKPIVLLSTGGFYPIHQGHIDMMEKAKEVLEKDGYDVVGGYLSLSHDKYISTKPYYICTDYERIHDGEEKLENHSWLMIDPWESLYVNSPINFTNVIERLEKYLQKFIDSRIQVAYVFGGDNAYFMYCFEKDGIGICVNRTSWKEDYYKVKRIQNERLYFVNGNYNCCSLSSRNIRKNLIQKQISYSGNYLIRNEGILPLERLLKIEKKEKLELLQNDFMDKFVLLLKRTFQNQVTIKKIDMQMQLEKASYDLKGKKTINLDSYFKGTYNIELSRLFPISSYQHKFSKLTGRIGHDSIEEQLNLIPKGKYVLVDDDSVSGMTLNYIRNNLFQDIKIEDVYLLANSMNENIFDVVDLRDFIIGANGGGLVVELPNGVITRAPYVLPYVNLTTRASVPPNFVREFSISIWKYNKDFYKNCDSIIKLKDLDKNFVVLMEYIGFNKEDKVVDICQWHIEQLSNKRIVKKTINRKY